MNFMRAISGKCRTNDESTPNNQTTTKSQESRLTFATSHMCGIGFSVYFDVHLYVALYDEMFYSAKGETSKNNIQYEAHGAKTVFKSVLTRSLKMTQRVLHLILKIVQHTLAQFMH